MLNYQAAIISKNKSLSRFFELELANCGFAVSIFEKYIFDISNFLFVIIDTDTVKKLPSIDLDKMLLVGRAEAGSAYDGALYMELPVSVNRLQAYCEDIKLRAAFKNISGNTRSDAPCDDVICFFEASYNTVRYRNISISLSDCEVKLLRALCEKSPEPVSREEINQLLDGGKGNIADVYIFKLRKKLEKDGHRLISTVRSCGYRISARMEWR